MIEEPITIRKDKMTGDELKEMFERGLIEMPTSTISKSISFPDWLLKLVDHFDKINGLKRSETVCRGVKKHILFLMRPGALKTYAKMIYRVGDDKTKKQMDVSMETWLTIMVERHCEDCNINTDELVSSAVLRYILLKDNHPDIDEKLFADMEQGVTLPFRGIFS